jgi:hypothetical protein
MTLRRVTAPLLFLVFLAPLAAAQSPLGRALITVSGPSGAAPADLRVELVDESAATLVAAAAPGSAGRVVTFTVRAGAYRLRISATDLQPVETGVAVRAGEAVAIDVVLASAREGGVSRATETDRFPFAYQTRFEQHHLDALPHSRTASSLLETGHPFLVSDQIDGGGLTTGEQPLLGGQGSSGTQTTWRLDGVDVTDPEWTGRSLFFPDLRALQSLTVVAASLDASTPGPAPAIDMVQKQPGRVWTGAAEFTGAPASMQAEAGDLPPIARLESWVDGGAAGGGAVGHGGARLFLSGRAARVERVERESPATLEGAVRAFTAHVTTNTAQGDNLRLLGSFSGTRAPLTTRARFADRALTQSDDALLVHGSWGRAHGSGQWTLGGAYQRAEREAGVAPEQAGGVMERLVDGPPLALLASDATTRQRWALSAYVNPGTRHWIGADHVLDAGASIGGASAASSAGPEPAFGELVNGVPARVWQVASAGADSHRGTTTLSAYATDRLSLGDSLAVTAAIRLDVDRGSADGAQDRIAWTTLLPRAHARWRPREGAFSIVSGYGWYGHRLPLGYLAVGDPAGVVGTMSRWDDRDGDRAWSAGELTPVAAIGLCCVGAEASRIDPDLRRPVTREFRIGGEHTFAGWRFAVTGLDRREDHLVTLVNTGVTLADYSVAYVDDPGVDIAGLSGSAPLPIYNRRPESALQDRYVLANTSAVPSRYQGLDVVLEHDVNARWFLRFGGMAYRSEGVGASRGYRSDENDQGVLGEALVTPNAATNARGRLFYDRGYVMKVLGAYTAPRVLSGAFVARYQDGQPFARLIVADGLTQGRDLVQTYGRGGQRFTYTVTLDARVAAEWPFAARRSAGLVFEAFNLLNLANEVEEDIVTGPAFRTITAVQPPRVVRLGVRLSF